MKVIRSNTMCIFLIAALTGGILTAGAQAGELLFRDNFNHPDTNIFDNASLAGRLSGTLASNVVLRSSIEQQTIQGNQLRMIKPPTGTKTGRITFNKQDLSARYDWAAGTTGTSILNAGGLRVEFDYTSPAVTGDWIAFSIGHDTSDPDRRLVDSETDYGILLRGSGGAQRFDNGAGVGVGSFTSPQSKKHVVIDFAITSFADGASVDVVVTVSGIQVDSHTFTWDNNNGEIYMELGSYFTGALIDSYSVSTVKTTKSLLFKDNFDVADTTSFDGASLSGRLSGMLDTQIKLAAAKKQHQISGNQLSMVKGTGTGRVKFLLQSGGWHNWATNETSTLILDAGGLIVGFDWTTASITTGDWISFCAGFATGAEPNTRLTDAGTDYGILFRGNGGTQRFDNGTGSPTGTFTPSMAPQHVELRFGITSFADGESVDVVTTVGGTEVDSYTFDLAENNGEFYMELGTYLTGMLIDNYSVDLIPAPTGTIIMLQ